MTQTGVLTTPTLYGKLIGEVGKYPTEGINMMDSVTRKANLIVAQGKVEQAVLDYNQAVRLYGQGGARIVSEVHGPIGFPAIEAERALRDAMAEFRALGGVLA